MKEDPKKTTAAGISEIIRQLLKGSEEAIGNYLFKGFRIQISRYKASGTERYMRLYRQRKNQGLCIRCGAKVTRKNPKTGALYRLCDAHRETTDRR